MTSGSIVAAGSIQRSRQGRWRSLTAIRETPPPFDNNRAPQTWIAAAVIGIDAWLVEFERVGFASLEERRTEPAIGTDNLVGALIGVHPRDARTGGDDDRIWQKRRRFNEDATLIAHNAQAPCTRCEVH